MQEENGGGGGSGTRQGAVTTEVMGVQIDMVKRIYLPYNCSWMYCCISLGIV
jgi:hypothetical protein